ncbi:hypothetical protein ACHAWC_007858 [Mediolabrus comicus]
MSNKGDETLPLGIYVPPPTSSSSSDSTTDGCKDASLEKQQHSGYVRIADAKGKCYPCGFSRPIGTIMETIVVAGTKRSHSVMSNKTECVDRHDIMDKDDVDDVYGAESEPKTNEIVQQKRTITEERIHPEEALFLHMRGLLRIECNNHEAGAKEESTTLSTQDLFCNMLPECKISLAAYLAYAHLRAQGYILMRYSTERMKLLLARKESHDDKPNASSEATECIEDEAGTQQYKRFITERLAKQRLIDDVATAPQPYIVSFDEWNSNRDTVRLAYHAYNPNSNFKRTNPGLPDFGVAVMPFHSSSTNAPTFDVISSLVALCHGVKKEKNDDNTATSSNEIPLRIATVADGGAVIVYGVTRGDVPVIDKKKGT